jgi:hypothetical protein
MLLAFYYFCTVFAQDLLDYIFKLSAFNFTERSIMDKVLVVCMAALLVYTVDSKAQKMPTDFEDSKNETIIYSEEIIPAC